MSVDGALLAQTKTAADRTSCREIRGDSAGPCAGSPGARRSDALGGNNGEGSRADAAALFSQLEAARAEARPVISNFRVGLASFFARSLSRCRPACPGRGASSSRVPVLQFHDCDKSIRKAGAAARGVSGQVYLGCNLEFRGVDLYYCIHAGLYTHVCMYVCMSVCMYVYICIYMYTHTITKSFYMYVHMYTETQTHRQTDRQTDTPTQTDRQTHIICIYPYACVNVYAHGFVHVYM